MPILNRKKDNSFNFFFFLSQLYISFRTIVSYATKNLEQ